jgi:hypothetical protein
MHDQYEIYTEIQRRLTNSKRLTVVVGTGSSMSVDKDFGMNSLENQLKNIIPNQIINDTQAKEEWENVLGKLVRGIDFENSLDEVRSPDLLKKIIQEAGSFVCSVNKGFIPKLQKREIAIPISSLFKALYQKLSIHNPTIDIITPNYDLLLEYAFINAKVFYSDGFYGDVQKEFDWKETENEFLRKSPIKVKGQKTGSFIQVTKTHFRLHKIHGSLNYFVIGNKIVRDDTLSFIDGCEIERFIITPGKSKFERIVETREFYKETDKAIEKADCFIFVGYGFNDNDIDLKIRTRLNESGKNTIIVTKELSNKGKEIIKDFPDIIAVEENDKENGSVIHFQCKDYIFPENLWKIDTFVKEIL